MDRQRIGIILSSFDLGNLLGNVTFSEMLRAFREEVHRYGYALDLLDSSLDLREFIRTEKHLRYAGIIAAASSGNAEALLAFRIVRRKLPFISLFFPVVSDTNTILADDEGSMRLLIDHLYRDGYRHFGFASLAGERFTERRRQGFIDAMHTHSLAAEKRWIFDLPAAKRKSQWGKRRSTIDERAKILAERIFGRDRPEVIVCETDHLAFLLALEAERRGVSVPDEILLTGVDNLVDFHGIDQRAARRLRAVIPTVDQNYEALGREAVRLIHAMLRGRKPLYGVALTVKPRLIVRSRGDTKNSDDGFTERVNSYIDRHITDALAMSRIADSFGVSHPTFLKKFKQACRRQFTVVVNERRIERSKELLSATSKSVAKIWMSVGYASYENYHKMFKRMTGMTPQAYREMQKSTDASGADQGRENAVYSKRAAIRRKRS